jgi:putative membrane protein
MKEIISWFAKGLGIGAANVIPGVSGGTIALITGIFERLINALKSFNLKSLKLLIKLKLKEFAAHTDLKFLLFIFSGVAVSIFTLARLLEFLFVEYPVFVWAYFFGLILASVYFVGKTVDKFSLPIIISFIIGTAIAVWISFLNPATENASFWFLIICGIIAIISMILPGISGSFVLILLGNYTLILHSVNVLDFNVLLPVIIGAAIGLPAFSGFLSWIFKKFKNQTIATLTGFIFGSLLILWPWKKEIYLLNDTGLEILNKDGERIVSSYERYLPDGLNSEVLFGIAFFIIGILSIWTIEHFAKTKNKAV